MSGPSCATCTDARRPQIDAALVAGGSSRDVGGRFHVSKSAIARHRKHVGQAIVRASERKAERFEETLLSKVVRLEADARRLGERAEREGDIRCALAAVREMSDVVKLLREMTKPAETSEADLGRVLAWFAVEHDVSIDEMRTQCEKTAEIQAELLAGRTPPHTERALPVLPPPMPSPPPPVSVPVAAPQNEPVPNDVRGVTADVPDEPKPRWRLVI